MAAGTITLNDGARYTIKHHNFPRDLTTVAQIEGDKIKARGVNGSLTRWVQLDYNPFFGVIHISCTSIAAALACKKDLEAWNYRFVTLDITFSGTSRKLKNLHILQNTVRIIPSFTVAADISAETHTVIMQATYQPTEDELS